VKLNHKLRISLAAATATGLLLAVVFACIIQYAHANAHQQMKRNLSAAMLSLNGDARHLEIEEFLESHPELGFAEFSRDNTLVQQEGSFHLKPHLGFDHDDDSYSLGERRHDHIVVIGGDWKSVKLGVKQLAAVLVFLWFPLTLLVALVTYLSARSVFHPLSKLTEQASSISGSQLGSRLDTADKAEFGEFAQSLNRMLDRIEETVRREDQFASDAAHELRTPLAILRTQVETTLLRPRSETEYVQSHQALLVELDRLNRIVEALLRTARQKSQEAPIIDLEPVVHLCAGRWLDRFVSQQIFMDVSTQPIQARITAEEFEVVLDNLLDNALRFSPPESTVKVTMLAVDDTVRLTVSDQGQGIPTELGDSVFERFVRAGSDRNRKSGGSGIGLAVCRKILEGRNGSIQIESTGPDGTSIRCILPITSLLAG